MTTGARDPPPGHDSLRYGVENFTLAHIQREIQCLHDEPEQLIAAYFAFGHTKGNGSQAC